MNTHNTPPFRKQPKLRSQAVEESRSIDIHLESEPFIRLINESQIVAIHPSYICRGIETAVIGNSLGYPCINCFAIANIYYGAGVLVISAYWEGLDGFIEAGLVCVRQGKYCTS
jgi:hypothetical protein